MAYSRDEFLDPYEDYIINSATSQQPQKRYNTTANWLDPFNPPQPQDPYYAEWAAANPGIPESSGAAVGQQLYGSTNAPYPGAAVSAPGAGPSGSGSGGAGLNTPTPFAWPQYSAPGYTPTDPMQAPPAFSFPEFSYGAFKAPTMEQAAQEPGYALALEQGRKALENSAAAKGVLRTGGTLKDLFSWGNKFAEQNYGGVFNREKSIYDTNRAGAFMDWTANRDNAASNYATNYGIARDVFDRNYKRNTDTYDIERQRAQDVFNPKFDIAKLSFSDLYNRWRDQLNSLTSIAGAGAGL